MNTPRTALEENTMKVWDCKIGSRAEVSLPSGCDHPMRVAVQKAYFDITGIQAEFTFSGWGGELTENELAVVENRLPRDIPNGKALSEALGGWLPIESAPRDGTRIILFRRGHTVLGNWDFDKYANKPRPYWSHDKERSLGVRDAREDPPTHWRPDFAPPTSAIGESA